MSTTIFTGCSYTSGAGFTLDKNDPSLWVNILHSTNTYLKNTDCMNLGEHGAPNQDIFDTSISALFKYTPKYMFVEWTEYPRYKVLLGLETYSAIHKFTPSGPTVGHNLHNINYTSSYLENIRNRFLSLHNPHLGILNIVKYTNALINIAKTTNTRIFFINGLCAWDLDYFVALGDVAPNQYTTFTQKLLDCATRDDENVLELYNRIHADYQQAGGIQKDHWLNLYNSMRSNRIDTNNDGVHPGIQSNQLYVDIFSQTLTQSLSECIAHTS